MIAELIIGLIFFVIVFAVINKVPYFPDWVRQLGNLIAGILVVLWLLELLLGVHTIGISFPRSF